MKRKEDSLRRKFSKLYTSTIPTGAPELPDINRRAKWVRVDIIEKADTGGSDIGNLYFSDSDEPLPGQIQGPPADTADTVS